MCNEGVLQRGNHEGLSNDTHTLGSAVVLHLRSSLTADMLMAARGEALERSTRRGLLDIQRLAGGLAIPLGHIKKKYGHLFA